MFDDAFSFDEFLCYEYPGSKHHESIVLQFLCLTDPEFVWISPVSSGEGIEFSVDKRSLGAANPVCSKGTFSGSIQPTVSHGTVLFHGNDDDRQQEPKRRWNLTQVRDTRSRYL